MRKSLKARGAYEPSMSAGEGCECYRPDTGAYGYLSVFWVNKGDGGANDFQYHFYREGADGNFYDNDWTIGDRDALKGELKDYKAELGDSFTVCPAICFPEGGIDVD